MQPPALVTDLSVAAWLPERLESWGWERGVPVTSQVPTGFDVYLRLFHPVDGRRWDRIAAERYRFAHPLMQWEGLCRHQADFVDGPDIGSLPAEQLERLFSHLPPTDEAIYGFWDGFSIDYLAAELDRGQGVRIDPRRSPVLDLPGRSYVLLTGPLRPMVLVDGRRPSPRTAQSPNLIWPADRSWFVATEIDFRFTLIGCDAALAEALLGDPQLEVVRVQPHDRMDYDGDTVNTKLPAWG